MEVERRTFYINSERVKLILAFQEVLEEFGPQ